MVIALILVVILRLAGSFLYVRDTLHGESQPNRMTFFIWACGPFIATAASLAAGVSWAVIPVFMGGFGPFCIFLASFVNPKAYWKLNTLDYACGLFAILGLVLWLQTDNPSLAIIFAILADGIAWIPTLIKAWKYPESETGITYVFALAGTTIGLLVAPEYSFIYIGFLLYLFINELVMVIATHRYQFFRSP